MDAHFTMTSSPGARIALSRRALLAAGLAAAALQGMAPLSAAARWSPPARHAATHHLWLLDSASELRQTPLAAPRQEEVDELLARQGERSSARRDAIARWGDRPAPFPWTDLTFDLINADKPSPPRAARALALVHVAMSDAVAAVADAQATYSRPAPAATIAGLSSLTAESGPSFPSPHAAVAGGAAAVLRDLFVPAEARRLAGAEEEAAASRVWAGASYRGDVEAGLAIGRELDRRAVARGRCDGSEATGDSLAPTGTGLWQPTPPDFRPDPLEPVAGTWKTWVLPSGDALRPSPPPAWGSPGWQAELRAVQEAVARHTPEHEEAAHIWAGGPGTVTPAGQWIEIARDLIARDWLGDQQAAHILAAVSVALADAFICCWDAKYTYWMARPVTADPKLDVLIPTPPFPSYTSGHATVSAAAATVLGAFFPTDADVLAAKAVEAKSSRLWAGIHFPIDNDMGALGGGVVGRLVIAAIGSGRRFES
jgi:membrane-associated phospholipid phosphatase